MLGRRLAQAAVIAVLGVATLGGGSAVAFWNAPVGTAVNYSLSSPMLYIGTMFTCSNGSMSGTVTNNPGAGGTVGITSKAFTSCTSGGTAAYMLPASGTWTHTVDVFGEGTLTGFGFEVRFAGLTCRYSGTLTTKMASLGRVVLSGSVTKVSGPVPWCQASYNVAGAFDATNWLGDPLTV